ncbi:outer membrane protein transport protein [Marinifilum fragile]|uniref:OmpP1/FadL family transporter n=1 Tax=Marinifilum fragile TaxID=570161 RepID=UPI002AABDF4E|nr:outer membrane protein transport protein [Marinifilum fragile]
MKRIYILISFIIIAGVTYAQTADDALRYSKQYFNGTARSAAMGGAFGALGGDFTGIAINPAGLAVYQTSELSFSSNLNYSDSKSLNVQAKTSLNEDKYSLGISNIGYVSTNKPRIESAGGWKNFNFAIGYNKLNTFRKNARSNAPEAPTSLLDVMVNNSNGRHPNSLNSFREFLAYDTYLIDTISGSNNQYIAITDEILNQAQTIDEKGYAGEFLMAFAANYNHKFYIGGSLGIQSIYYKSTKVFSESILSNSDSDFNDYSFEEYYKSSGVGANFKLGMIYKPEQWLRLGASIHTPTFYTFDEDYHSSMASNFNTADENGYSSYYAQSPQGKYSYKFRTPLKATFSAALVLKKRLILSADYELIDYSKAKFYDGDNGEDFNGTPDNPDTNDIIKASYQSTGNLRTGLEFRATPNFSLRAGYAKMGNSFKVSGADDSFDVFSGGFGFRQNNFFMDLAYSYADVENQFVYYSTPDFASDQIKENNKKHEVKVTFGFKF